MSNKNNGKYKSISELNFLDKKKIKISDHDQVISTMPITELAKILKIKKNYETGRLKYFASTLMEKYAYLIIMIGSILMIKILCSIELLHKIAFLKKDYQKIQQYLVVK